MLKKASSAHHDDGMVLRGLSNVYFQMGKKRLSEDFKRKAEELSVEMPLIATVQNYRTIAEIARAQGILILSVSYANRGIAPVRRMLDGLEGVFFADNGAIFKQALAKAKYGDYFTDAIFGDFGHFTPKGARLVAGNIAEHIVKIFQQENPLQ